MFDLVLGWGGKQGEGHVSIPTSHGPHLRWWLCTITTVVRKFLFSLCSPCSGGHERVEQLTLSEVKTHSLGDILYNNTGVTIRQLLFCSFEQ